MKKKKLFALILSAALLLSMAPPMALTARATEEETPLAEPAEPVCTHHTEHTAECGYKEAVEKHPCAHVCEWDCFKKELTCPHEHDADCLYVAPTAEVPCTHQHDESCGENGETCTHTHDEECGHVPADPGVPCGHEHTKDCYTVVTTCGHVHNGECAWEEGVEGSCTHICDESCQTPVIECTHPVEHNESCLWAQGSEASPCSFVCTECAREEEPEPTEEPKPEPTPEVSEEPEENTYLLTLLEQTSWRALFDAMMADPDAAMALTEEQIMAVEAHAYTLPAPETYEDADMAQDEREAKDEVVSTIEFLLGELSSKDGEECTCGIETGEHTPDCPKFGTEDASAYAGVISNSDGVYIGRTKMTEGLTIEDGNGGTAHYSNGVLTLNDFDYSGNGSYAVFSGAQGSGAITSVRDLTIVINGTNNITYRPDETQYGTYACGIRVAGHNLIIQGDGTLNVSATDYDYVDTAHQNHRGGSSFGVFVTGGLTIKEGVTVNATGNNAGQMSRGLAIQGNLLITDYAVVNARANDVSRTYGHSNSIGIDCSVNTSGEAGMIIEKNAQVYAISGSSNVTQGCSDGTCNMNICGSFGLFAACGITISGNTHVEAIAEESTCSSIGILTAPWQRSDNTAAMEPLNISGTAVVVAKTLDNGITTNNRSFGMYGTVNNTTTESQVFVGESEQNVVKLTKEQEKMLASYVEDHLHYVSIEPADYPVWVEGIQVTRDNWHDVLGTLDSGVTVHFDRINYILYLDGYTTITSNVHKFPVDGNQAGWLGFPVAGDKGSTGVIAAGCDLTIHVKNDSTINANRIEQNVFNCGILSGYDLKITADAGKKLTINAADSSTGNPVGIYASGNNKNTNSYDGLTLHDLTLDITAGTGVMTRGIECAQNIYISGASKIKSEGGASPTNNSFGIMAWASEDTKKEYPGLTNNIYIRDSATVVASTGNTKGSPAGIRAESSLYISTSGSVTATSGDSSNEATYGLIAVENVNISAGTVSVQSGDAQMGRTTGICAMNQVTISGNANVTVESGEAKTWESNGIYAINAITIADQASVSATAGKAKGMSSAIFCEGKSTDTGWKDGTGNVTITTSGTVTATGGKTTGGADYQLDAEGNKPGSHSRGIFARDTLTISSGTVNALGGNTCNTVGEYNGSHALDAHKEMIIQGTAKVVAQGGPSNGTSTGMSGHQISILDSASVNSQSVDGEGKWNVGIAGQAKNQNTVPAKLLIQTTGTVTAIGHNCSTQSGSYKGNSIGAHIAGHVEIINSPNVTFTGSDSPDKECQSKGLYANISDGNIGSIIITNSTVTASSGKGAASDGIQANQTITITDSKVTSTANTAVGRSSGITANHAISITGSTIDASGSTSTGGNSYGIWSTAGNVTIDGGTVTATGGDTPLKTYGIYAADKVTISDAKVEATGGICTYDGAYIADNNQRIYQSGGIVGIKEISITNSDVTATGGTNKTGPTWGLLGTEIRINGGEVTATGGESPRFYSAGIAARDDGTDGTPTLGSLSITNEATVTASNVGKAGNQSQPRGDR